MNAHSADKALENTIGEVSGKRLGPMKHAFSVRITLQAKSEGCNHSAGKERTQLGLASWWRTLASL